MICNGFGGETVFNLYFKLNETLPDWTLRDTFIRPKSGTSFSWELLTQPEGYNFSQRFPFFSKPEL